MRQDKRRQHNQISGMTTNTGIDCLLLNPPSVFSRYPYLGLCLLASLLKERGITVEILDSSVLAYSLQDVIDHIRHKRPRIIGISIMSVTLRSSYQVIQAVKESYPEGIIVVGGSHINADPQIVVPMNAHYGFWGECEFEFVGFCEQILAGRTPNAMPGLIINDNGHLSAGEPKVLSDLDCLPMPAYELLPLHKYYSPSTNLKTVSHISSRGCPYNCKFCSRLLHRTFSCLSTENMVNQVEKLISGFGIQWIEFVDEIFTLNEKRVIEFCESIISRKLSFQWGCGTRADRINEELVTLMKNAGCRKIGFGIETGVERVRFVINKRITNQQIIKAVKICRKHGLKVQGCFILGHPTETIEEMRETVRFARKLGLNTPNFAKMIPIPNSELFEEAKEKGSIAKDSWTAHMLGKRPFPLYTPESVSPNEVDKIFRKAWFATYFWPSTLWHNRSILFSPCYLYKSTKAFFDCVYGKRYK